MAKRIIVKVLDAYTKKKKKIEKIEKIGLRVNLYFPLWVFLMGCIEK